MYARDAMKSKLKILAGLPGDPTDAQLDAIIADIVRIQRERTPTESDWKAASARWVPGAGTNKYAGVDMSDLNRLLAMIQSTSPQAGSGGGSNPSSRK